MHIPHNERGIQPGPLATFPKWKESGRHVNKGEKALTLCMPLTCKRTRTVITEDGTEKDEDFAFTHFTYKAHCYHKLEGSASGALKTRGKSM
jgi:N-terminal domain of anti-restriction factor ArdC